ncbi:MAG: sensor histidine kinase [Terriglobia bacterium]
MPAPTNLAPNVQVVDSARRALERIKALARLVLAASLGLGLLLAQPQQQPLTQLLAFIFGVYFLYAVLVLLFREQLLARQWRIALLGGDGAVLLVVVLFAPSQPAAFLLFFLYFTLVAGLWGGWWAASGLSLLVSAAYVWVLWRDASRGAGTSLLLTVLQSEGAVVGGLLAAGLLVGSLAQRERRQIERAASVERFALLLNLDGGWPELWRRWLRELCREFRAERAFLAYHDPETDRIALWDFRRNGAGEGFEESDRPPRDARMFLFDFEPYTLSVNGLDRPLTAHWRLRLGSGELLRQKKFDVPERFVYEFSPRSLLSVPVAVGGEWRARLFLLDAYGGEFAVAALDELEGLLARLAPILASLLTVRSLMTRRVNQERDRVVRELHDGVAQTLASLEMQLDVFRRLAAREPERTAEELGRLQGVVKQEQEDLRRYLRTLKTVRVSATELGRWVLAHCARFQEETGIEVDVEAEPLGAALPEGVCREVFMILREALHNVRKHAGAEKVMVRLRQDDTRLRLVVDDDGRGFPFSGSYSLRAMEETGMAPVSIGEHTRAVGGTLVIDSTPGSGATLRVEIPLH